MSATSRLAELRAARPAVLPSLLLCDFAALDREVARLEAAGVRGLHLDVMDGHFVPNLTYGLPLVETFRRLTPLPLDVHLMVSNPGPFVGRYIDAGADLLTIHVEAVERPADVLREIRRRGAGAGLALNPDTPLERVLPLVEECDLILVMSVMPGFGGQAFNPAALDKLRRLAERAPPELMLEVDGGVNRETLAACRQAGAQLFVVGSAIFRQPDYTAAVERLNAQMHTVEEATR